MRLRHAVLQTPAESSVLPRLPLHNSRPLLTHSESTLPQLLIPLHFNFPRINTSKKPGGGYPSQGPKVLQLVTTHTTARCTQQLPQPQSRLWFTSRFSGHPGGWGVPPEGQPSLADHRLSPRITDTCQAPMVRSYRCAATPKVPESQLLLVGGTPGNISAPPVSNKGERTSGWAPAECQTRSQVGPGTQSLGSHEQEGLGSTVLMWRTKVEPTSRVARAS
jgi:hypothetical protein